MSATKIRSIVTCLLLGSFLAFAFQLPNGAIAASTIRNGKPCPESLYLKTVKQGAQSFICVEGPPDGRIYWTNINTPHATFKPHFVKNCISYVTHAASPPTLQCDQAFATAQGHWIRNCIKVFNQSDRQWWTRCDQAFVQP